MRRSGAIRAVARCCPPLAGLLASSWCQGARLTARTRDKDWVSRTSFRGGAQGWLSTQVAFCSHVHEVLLDLEGLQLPGVVKIGIVDDQYMVGQPATIAACWPQPERAVGEAGYGVRRHKCKMWASGKAAGLSVGAQMRIDMLAPLIPESHDSLPLLGAATEGTWYTLLGPFAAAAAPAMARVQNVEAVCEALRRYVAAQPDEHAKQAAHTILQKSVAMALC